MIIIAIIINIIIIIHLYHLTQRNVETKQVVANTRLLYLIYKSKEEKPFFKTRKIANHVFQISIVFDWLKNFRDFGCLSTCWLE